MLATLVDALYRVEPPVNGDSRTTYNVGTISGGTSVNTVAQSAEMLYEYRSNDARCLERMQAAFEETVAAHTPADAELSVERIGERPCAGDVDEAAWAELILCAEDAIRAVTGKEADHVSSSTDCNIPLSMGIPAICIGGCVGGKCHTREEWLDTSSLADGCRLFLEFFRRYCMA